jgi:hypothetical protein
VQWGWITLEIGFQFNFGALYSVGMCVVAQSLTHAMYLHPFECRSRCSPSFFF